MSIYEKIAAIAAERKIPIYKLEKEAGIGNGVISGWKEGQPQVDTLKKVADALEVSIEELI